MCFFGINKIKNCLLMVLFVVTTFVALSSDALTLVKGGKSKSAIVVDEQASPAEKYAAEELQDMINKITGVELQITDKVPINVNKLYIGTIKAPFVKKHAKAFANDLKALKGTDGFAVRKIGDDIFIFGCVPKGVLNGVYRFLEENTDIIWARPEAYGTIYSKSDTLRVKNANFSEKPAFPLRGWHIVRIWQHNHEGTERWMARNLINKIPMHPKRLKLLGARRQKMGYPIEHNGGHNLLKFITKEKYYKDHPEFFAFVNGERRATKQVQLCFRNKDMVKAFIKEAKAELSRYPTAFGNFTVGIEDTWSTCRCPLCKTPLTLPDGSVLSPDDKAYDSTCFFMFLNQVAEALHKDYPDMRIGTMAYFFTTEPPKVKLFKTIDISLCIYPRCDKQTIENPVNNEWIDKLKFWVKATPNLVWREYYGLSGSFFPRPIANTVVKDLRTIKKIGLNGGVYSELIPDEGSPVKRYKPFKRSSAWDASAMQFYLICQLEWNPYQDFEKLRERFITRTYREAAPAMRRYYNIIRKAFYATPRVSRFNDDVIGSFDHYIRQAGLEEKCHQALLDAKKSAEHPGSRRMIEAHLRHFNLVVSELNKRPVGLLKIPYDQTPLGNVLDFNDAAWSNAAVIDGFKQMGTHEPSAHKTVIRLSHDAKNLYIGWELFDKDTSQLAAPASGKTGKEPWPGGDTCELFIDGDQKAKGLYYHLAFDSKMHRYDEIGTDKNWNGDWQIKINVDKDAWRGVLTLPLSTIGVDLNKKRRYNALFFRMYPYIYRSGYNKKGKKVEHSSWNGGKVHMSSGMSGIEFGK